MMSLKDRFTELYRNPDFKIFSLISLTSLVYYASLIRVQFTFGDGPELLTAMYRLGGPHPSGYPLFTMLGFIPARIGIPSPWWLASFATAAVPGALAAGFLYLILREVTTIRPIAVLAALAFALNTHIVYQATRVEVYALHCFLGAVALWSIAIYLRKKELRYAYVATLFTSLALTNHLTSVFLVIPITVGMMLGNHKQIMKPKTILILLGIGAACASIYFYLPIQAMLNHGDKISWNDPQTLKNFWFHVSGEEYASFRKYDRIPQTLNSFHNSLNNTFFPGVLVIMILGIFELFLKRGKLLIVLILFSVSTLGYIAIYPINDIATYYSLIFWVAMFFFALGANWLANVRFSEDEKTAKLTTLKIVAVGISIAWLIGLAWNSTRNGYKEAVAQEMSEAIVADMKDPAIIFTTVDGHTFPMWYQAYVGQPDRHIIPIDAVMFTLKNKQWYRDFFFDNFKEINWPTNEMSMGAGWREYLIENNPKVNFYALLDEPWKFKGSWAENHGWHTRLHRGKPPKADDVTIYAKHIYIAQEKAYGGAKYFFDTLGVYHKGVSKIACVAEWTKHPGITAAWIIKDADGNVIVDIPKHEIPKDSNQSWEYLELKDQKPGIYTCEVKRKGEKLLKKAFKIIE